MYLGRAVTRTLALPRWAPIWPPPRRQDVFLRWMSSNKFPGSSGSNMIYYLVVGVTISAGGYYTYKRTVTSDQARHTKHVANFTAKTNAKLQPLQGEKENLAEAEEANSDAPVVSFLEAEQVDAGDIPEAMEVAVAEETAACVGQMEADQVETPNRPEAPMAALGEDKEVRPEAPSEVTETASGETQAVRSEVPLEVTEAIPGETWEVRPEAPSEVIEAAPVEAAAMDDDEGTSKEQSSGEQAELEEESSPVASASSAREDVQGEAATDTEVSSVEG